MSKTSLELMQERYATLVEKLQEKYGGNAAVECGEPHVHVPPGMYPSIGLLHMLDLTMATIRRQEEIATKLEENLVRLQALPHDALYPFDLENVTTQIANARAHKAMAEENLVLQLRSRRRTRWRLSRCCWRRTCCGWCCWRSMTSMCQSGGGGGQTVTMEAARLFSPGVSGRGCVSGVAAR